MTAQADPLDWANGVWGTDIETMPEGTDGSEFDESRVCDGSAVLISTNREDMRYEAVHTGEGNLKAKASVLNVGSKWLSIRYDDEERLMENGEPQIWHMFFLDQNTFYWVLGPGISEEQRDGIVPVARVRCQNLVG